MSDRFDGLYGAQESIDRSLIGRLRSKRFRIDAGAQAAGTDTTESFAAGSIILGFSAKTTEAVTSAGSATVQLGFTSTTMLSNAIAKATLADNYRFGPNCDGTEYFAPLHLTAADTFDCIVAVATLTAGKFDIEVIYIEPLESELDSGFTEWTTA